MTSALAPPGERFRKVTLTAADLGRLTILDPRRLFNGNAQLPRFGLQTYALGIAYKFDPYSGLSISRVDPLPHQLEAVCDYLLKLGRVHFFSGPTTLELKDVDNTALVCYQKRHLDCPEGVASSARQRSAAPGCVSLVSSSGQAGVARLRESFA